MVRIPGGSWSNSFDWESCEKYDQCSFGATEGWIIRPTEFITLLKGAGRKAMFTLNPNTTAKEAAALVAFFNGSENDNSPIGVDIRGKDWGRVSDWVRLRGKNGNPDPFFPVTWWEFGNEVYGGKTGQGKDCLSWGWSFFVPLRQQILNTMSVMSFTRLGVVFNPRGKNSNLTVDKL